MIFVCAVLFLAICPAPVGVLARIIGVIGWIGVVSLMIAILPEPPQVDGRQYFANYTAFSASELVNILINQFDPSHSFVYSLAVLPLVLKPLLGAFVSLGPWSIILPYGIIWMLSSFAWVKAVSMKRESPFFADPLFTSLLFVLLMTLPSVAYWSMSFMKEIPLVAFSVFSAIQFSRSKCISGIIFLLIATLLRPYAPGIVIGLFLFLQSSNKLRCVGFFGAIATLLIYSKGTLLTIAKVFLTLVYMFLSPNPLNASNWLLVTVSIRGTSMPTLFMNIEGIFLGLLFVIGLVILLLGRRRNCLFTVGLSLLFGSVILILVDCYYILTIFSSYSLFTFGAPLVRLKFSFWPLIATWSALTITAIVRKVMSLFHNSPHQGHEMQ
ncbi:hypothetical protein [Acetomicrobium sp. S15 = DSM 107314]|uniref:hypothetical protein n=1 Tax=Acetomicrobium sp. S15 = DSM 107314 TaxID=2529858 RepID=UPI0018E11D15|nr:hypothetical protein [Acetomicrobium sp. S15 = DSM 107314]